MNPNTYSNNANEYYPAGGHVSNNGLADGNPQPPHAQPSNNYQFGIPDRQELAQVFTSGANNGQVDRVLANMSEQDIIRIAMQLGFEVDADGHVHKAQDNHFENPPPQPSTPPPLKNVPPYPTSSTPGAWAGNHDTSYHNWVRTGNTQAMQSRPATVPSQSYSAPGNKDSLSGSQQWQWQTAQSQHDREQQTHMFPNQRVLTHGVWNPTAATTPPSQMATPATMASTPSPHTSVPATPSPASSVHSQAQSQGNPRVHSQSHPYLNQARASPTPAQVALPQTARRTSTALLQSTPPSSASSRPTTSQPTQTAVTGEKRPIEVPSDSEPEVVDAPPSKPSRKKKKAADDDGPRGRKHWTLDETSDLIHDVFDDESPYFKDLEDAKLGVVADNLALTPRWTGKRSSDAIKSKLEEIRRLYPCIKEYLSYTGGAGDVDYGDADADADENSAAAIAKRIQAMKKDTRLSSYTNDLTGPKVKMWLDGGLYDIIHRRYAGKATYERPNDYNTERTPSPFGGVRHLSSSPEPEPAASSQRASKASTASGSSKQQSGRSSSSKGVPEKPAKEKSKKGSGGGDGDGFTRALHGITGYMEMKASTAKVAIIQEVEKNIYAREEAHVEQCRKVLDGSDPIVVALQGTEEYEQIVADARKAVGRWLSGRTQKEIPERARRQVEGNLK